jgi:hypothetical protein
MIRESDVFCGAVILILRAARFSRTSAPFQIDLLSVSIESSPVIKNTMEGSVSHNALRMGLQGAFLLLR